MKTVKWEAILGQILSANVAHRILLHGPPGTGKSTAAIKSAKAAGKQCYRIQCTRQQPVEDLLGTWTLVKGETKFAPGPLPKAMASGGVLLLDEFDRRNIGHDSTYHAVLDDMAIASITLPDGSVVTPKDGFVVVLTTNEKPDVLSLALLSRIDVKLYCGSTADDAIASLPPPAKKLVVNAERDRTDPEWSCPIDVRSVQAWLRLSPVVGQDVAATLVFGKVAREVVSAYASNQ